MKPPLPTAAATRTAAAAAGVSSPTNSESSDLGAAASALFNLRASPVVLSQKQIQSHNKNMPFLSLSPPVVPTPSTGSVFQSTRARSQTWDASNSSLPSLGFLQQLVDTDANAAGTLCALMQSQSPLLTSINAKAPTTSTQKRPRSFSVAAPTQQERQNLKGLRPRSMSSMVVDASPVLFSSSSSSSRRRRPSRSMSLDSNAGGDFDDYLDDDEDDDEDDEDEEDADEFGNTVVSLEIVGQYSPDTRRQKIERFAAKRLRRIWRKRIKYDVRKNFADSRLRVKGRFVRKEDEDQLRDLLNMT